MSQSRAILTLHRRTGGDTQGGRALSRRTVRARGAPTLPCLEQWVTARTSRPGPASKLPRFGRRGLGESPANAAGRRRRLFVFKIRECVQAAGLLGGDPRRWRRRRPAAEGRETAGAGGRAGAGLQDLVRHHDWGRVAELKSLSRRGRKDRRTFLGSCVFLCPSSVLTGYGTGTGARLPAGPSPEGWAAAEGDLIARAQLATP